MLAKQGLEDLDVTLAQVRVTADPGTIPALRSAALDQLRAVRLRCTEAQTLAVEAGERIAGAQQRLAEIRAGVVTFGETAASPELADLRARIDSLAVLLDLAEPLARSAARHLADAAAGATDGTVGQGRGEVLGEDRAHATSRDVGLASEALSHLDRTVQHAASGAGRARASVAELTAGARQRLHDGQQVTTQTPPTPRGPAR